MNVRALVVALALALGAAAACVFDDSLDGTSFRCGAPPDDRCPAGQTCVAGRCSDDPEPPPADAAPDDADAPPGPPPDADLCAPAGNDHCSGAILLGDGDVAHGSTVGFGSDLAPTPTCTPAIENGPDALYAVDLAAGQALAAELVPAAGFDAALYVLSACGGAATCLEGENKPGPGVVENLAFTAPSAGRYYLVVDATGPTVAGCYTLTVDLG